MKTTYSVNSYQGNASENHKRKGEKKWLMRTWRMGILRYCQWESKMAQSLFNQTLCYLKWRGTEKDIERKRDGKRKRGNLHPLVTPPNVCNGMGWIKSKLRKLKPSGLITWMWSPKHLCHPSATFPGSTTCNSIVNRAARTWTSLHAWWQCRWFSLLYSKASPSAIYENLCNFKKFKHSYQWT